MDFRGWIPPDIAILFVMVAMIGAPWIVFGVYYLASHLTIGWQP